MRLSDERFTFMMMLMVTYGTFLVWFAGYPMDGKALDDTEQDNYRKLFEGTAILEEMVSIDFEEFLQNDDGKSIGLAARVSYREDLKYPETKAIEGFTPAETVDDAVSTFVNGASILALQYGCTPLALFQDRGQLFRTVEVRDADEDDEDIMDRRVDDDESKSAWSQLWVLRFRARRDLLDILLELEKSGLNAHRVAAIGKMEATLITNQSNFLFSIDLTLQCLVGFVFTTIFLLSELCFPGPPKEKSVKKKPSGDKKVSKKGTKDKESTKGEKEESTKAEKEKSTDKEK